MATVRERVRELQGQLVEARRVRYAAMEAADVARADAITAADQAYREAADVFESQIDALGTLSGDAPVPDTRTREERRAEKDAQSLSDVLASMDRSDASLWTTKGAPRTAAVRDAAGDQSISAADVKAAWESLQ